MEFVTDVVGLLADRDTWLGARGIPFRTLEHVWISVVATAVGALVAMPPAMVLAHAGRGAFLASAVVNTGRAVPTFGVVVMLYPIALALGLGASGWWPTFAALFVLALPPIFINTYTAIRGVDPAAVEAGRGMGMTEREVLFSVEVPAGAPVMVAGLRIAFIQVIATATIGAVLPFGGLGRFIIDGFGQGDDAEVFIGALCVALLALGAERVMTMLERRLVPGVEQPEQPVEEQVLPVPV